MATFVINTQKKNGTRHANNNKQRKIAKENIRTQIDQNDGNKGASTFEERYQELEEKIKQKAAAAKSDLKQNEDEKTSATTEAEAEKKKRYDSSSSDGKS